MPNQYIFPGDLEENGLFYTRINSRKPFEANGFTGSADVSGIVNEYTGGELLASIALPLPESGMGESHGFDYQGFAARDAHIFQMGLNAAQKGVAAAAAKVKDRANVAGVAAAGKAFGGIFKDAGNLNAAEVMAAAKDAFLNLQNSIPKIDKGARNAIGLLMQSQIKQQVANLFGLEGVGDADLWQQGVAWNPAMRYAFSGVSARSFSFTWKLSPRNSAEATSLKEMLNYVRQHSHPGRKSYFRFDYPNEWDISFYTNGVLNSNHLIDGENGFLFKTRSCVMTGLDVQYGEGGSNKFYVDGSPLSMIVTMSFQELEVLSREHYGGNSGGND